MTASPDPLPLDAAVVLVLGARDEVLTCTPDAAELLGRPAEHITGQRLDQLLDRVEHGCATLARPGRPDSLRLRLTTVDLPGGGTARRLVTLTPEDAAHRHEEDQALVRALFSQRRVGIAIHRTDLRITRINLTPQVLLSATKTDEGQARPSPLPAPISAMLVPEDADALSGRLRQVVDSGEPVIDWEHTARLRDAPDDERVLSIQMFQLRDRAERVQGAVSIFTDITEQYISRRRMALLHAVAERIGATLDIAANAQELAKVLVPGFADLAGVDISGLMLGGDEPEWTVPGAQLRRLGGEIAHGEWPAEVYPPGALFRVEEFADPRLTGDRALREPLPEAVRTTPLTPPGAEPGPAAYQLPQGPGSRMIVPLTARGQVLGALHLWRAPGRLTFTLQDAWLGEEIGSRAALSLDNARRYTREHRTVESLQRSLLPQPVVELSAARTAGSYVAARTAAGTGGTWYDVIPLSSARVAFVIGDIAGHGLNATATMGRLRTAVQTLADLDLAPEELLTRLDDLAIRLADAEQEPRDGTGAVGATCLYCVYDPVSGDCTMAGAGRVPPVLALPGRPPEVVPLKAGPPLGVGGTPFESVRVRLEPDSWLLLFSDELVAARAGDGDILEPAENTPEERMELLRAELSAAGDRTPAELGRAVLDALLPRRTPDSEVALLVARVRTLPEDATAHWSFAADPAVVGEARNAVLDRLTEWGLDANVFATELIVSELVTNAIRYAGGPVELRLIRDETLICEVSDPSETQPHLRRARPTDEGGRGLFLVAQLAHRWGSRYTSRGKTIWTEQLLDTEPG
ncbi:SpoIIE family protein phosphatase [Streptomyces xiamenensis]|uniref:Protein phosphatase n=1 Tax=Streptomyces xiamenensis TaxID=408015 RepID=A0A0F7FQ58_9ACTN|nr:MULTISPECIES: SpoIIE family protein phosphatase [Streptomyces]AKG42068.1 protein phosphatase [Streptomyces xiamenensis]